MPSGRRSGPLPALVLGAALLLAPVAFADRTVLRDPAHDVDRDFASVDIRKVIVAHAKGGKLKHVVRVRRANRFTARNTGLRIVVPGGRRFSAGGIFGSGGVYDSQNERTGALSVRRRGNRIILIFHERAIGSPASYRWQVGAIAGPGDGGVRDADFAPNKGYKVHDLG